MAYVEVWKSGKLITRRRVNEQKAKTGLRVRLGSVGEVHVTVGESKTLGNFDVRVFEGEPPLGQAKAAETASLPSEGRRPAHGLDFSADDSAGGVRRVYRPPDIEGYRIIGQLGSGGMGAVWRAEQLSTQREVALKLMVSHRRDQARARARFEREVEITARLNHPNIGRVYDSGLHQGVYYYAMELIEGMPLDRYVRAVSLGRAKILALMRVVCEAVHYAHLRGVIHRDLKPSNIMVGRDGQPKVVDFGLARTFFEEDEGMTISIEGDVAGTPAYMSPEQAAGRHDQLDTRTDVFSLGVILYRLLTGQSPQELSGPLYDVLRQIVEGKIKRPRDVDSTIDSELEALLLKALAKEPQDRYASAGDLADDIDNYLRGEPLRAKAPTTLYFLRKKARKYRRQVGIAAGILVILSAVILVGYTKIVGERVLRKEVERRAEIQAAELKLKSEELDLVDLRVRALGKDKQQAEAALNLILEKYASAEDRINELSLKLGERKPAVAVRQVDLKRGEPTAPTALVRQPALPPGVKSWTLETLGHRGSITKLAHSPNGRLLASGSIDGTTRLWDAESGQLIRILLGSPDAVSDLSWSSDGKSLMSISQDRDNLIRLWDAESGIMQRSFPLGETSIRCVAWSPDGRLLASGSGDGGGDVGLWQVETGQLIRVLKGHTRRINAIAWSPDGRMLATGGADRTVRLWDPLAGRLIRSSEESEGRINSLAWAPHQPVLAIGHTTSQVVDSVTVRLWDTVSGKIVSSLKIPVEKGYVAIRNLAWTPNAQTIACTINGTIRIWEVKSGRVRRFSPGQASSLTWSADGKVLVFGNYDGEIRFWDSESGQLVQSQMSSSAGPVYSVSFSPGGRFLATAGRLGTICLWDARRWAPLSRLQAYGVDSPSFGGSVLAWSPGSDALAIGNDSRNDIVILHPQSGMILDVVHENEQPVRSIAWSPNGGLLATGHADGAVQLWNTESGACEALVRLDAHTTEKGYITISWSPDGNSLLSAGDNGTIKLWQPRTGEHLRSFKGHNMRVSSMAWSPDGETLASGSNDGTIRLWNVQSGRTRRVLKDTPATSGDRQSMFIAIAWSPNGTHLASTDSNADIQIWSPDSGKLLRSFAACRGIPTSLAWSCDGKYLVCGGLAGTASVWDVKNNYQPYVILLPLRGSFGPGMAINPEGDYRGPPGIEEHLVYVVQTDSGQELLTPKKYANRYGWINEPWQVGLHTPGLEEVQRMYVKADAQGPYDGRSWDTAFRDLQNALNAAQPNTEIWVAEGIYRPDRGTGARAASFRLKNAVRLFGGFSGAETSIDERDPNKHKTILSGDLKGDDGPDFANNDENSYHIVTAEGSVKNAVLDCFTISGGNANGLREDGHSDGGGMHNRGGHCALVNCNFIGNRADDNGGGIASGGSLTISNCTVSDNLAREKGGGLWCGGINTSVLTESTVRRPEPYSLAADSSGIPLRKPVDCTRRDRFTHSQF